MKCLECFFLYLEQYLSCVFILLVYLAICNVQYQVNDLNFDYRV